MVKYTSIIDSHVHFRGSEYSGFNFKQKAFDDLYSVGATGACGQPNTDPPIDSGKRVEKEGRAAEKIGKHIGIAYRSHIAFTSDYEQQNHVLSLFNDIKYDHLLGADKIFYARSTKSGNIEITDIKDQKRAWVRKVRAGYNGVSMGHFEDESSFRGIYDYNNPVSHSFVRNLESELIQVERQIQFANDVGFKGTFYIAHVSNPDTVDYVNKIKNIMPFDITLEITPHHMLLNLEDYEIHGNRVKMNPPLRAQKIQEKLFEKVLKGEFDVIGTDHAPHPINKKEGGNPASGIPGIPFWPKLIEILRKEKIDEGLLEDMTFNTANRLFFNNSLLKREVDVEYNPELWDKYGFNPFSRVDGS
jgi:dihydroorotase